MDLLTQGILGAVTAQVAAKKYETRIAAGAGFFAGLLPDADALIQSPDDSLLVLEYHRHFTHAIIFTPVVALIAALVLWPFLNKSLTFRRLYLFTFLGVLLAGFLDACTSYGTHLFWPFSDERISWSIISIVDPVFTLLLIAPLIIALMKYNPQFARTGLALAGLYLVFGVVQHNRAYGHAEELVAQRGHQAERLLVKPTIGNLVLWRSVYLADDRIYADGIRVGIFSGKKIFTGESLPLLNPESIKTLPDNSRAMQDLKRFSGFSDGWIAIHPDKPDYIGDLRYSMLPVSTMPLWGVLIDMKQPDVPLQFVTERTFTPGMRQDFIDMLLGRSLN
jgi:inner membrane protein